MYLNPKRKSDGTGCTSPPAASTEPSLLNAKANCCPTSTNWSSTLSDCFKPSLGSSLLSSSHSNHLQKKMEIYN